MGRLEFSGDTVSHASVALRDLPPMHPLSGGVGTDNRVAIHSCRYRGQPLLIQGPGAGADVVLFGSGTQGEPTAQDWAEAAGTISYEIVTRIGGRMTRRYVDR